MYREDCVEHVAIQDPYLNCRSTDYRRMHVLVEHAVHLTRNTLLYITC